MNIKLPSKEEIIKSRGSILTPEQLVALGKRNQEIANLRKGGMSRKELSHKYNLSEDHIKVICTKLGVRMPAPQPRKKKINSNAPLPGQLAMF